MKEAVSKAILRRFFLEKKYTLLAAHYITKYPFGYTHYFRYPTFSEPGIKLFSLPAFIILLVIYVIKSKLTQYFLSPTLSLPQT